VYSELGRGTAFKLYFPRVDEPIGAVARPREREERPSPATETILLVEDSIAIRRVVTRILRPLGYRMLEASGAREARSICEASPVIHLLLTDVVMPETTGPALASDLVGMRPDMKVLFMSGYSRATMEQHGTLIGANFLEKPFAPDGLVRKVREALDGPERATPAAPGPSST
jgi:DNA-binding NtrC family response regulator